MHDCVKLIFELALHAVHWYLVLILFLMITKNSGKRNYYFKRRYLLRNVIIYYIYTRNKMIRIWKDKKSYEKYAKLRVIPAIFIWRISRFIFYLNASSCNKINSYCCRNITQISYVTLKIMIITIFGLFSKTHSSHIVILWQCRLL